MKTCWLSLVSHHLRCLNQITQSSHRLRNDIGQPPVIEKATRDILMEAGNRTGDPKERNTSPNRRREDYVRPPSLGLDDNLQHRPPLIVYRPVCQLECLPRVAQALEAMSHHIIKARQPKGATRPLRAEQPDASGVGVGVAEDLPRMTTSRRCATDRGRVWTGVPMPTMTTFPPGLVA